MHAWHADTFEEEIPSQGYATTTWNLRSIRLFIKERASLYFFFGRSRDLRNVCKRLREHKKKKKSNTRVSQFVGFLSIRKIYKDDFIHKRIKGARI
ncbi:hypothetical protein TSAR_014989 [Trichomalopsis sarcophagae]|uniref:Uncharacterized protein n=1 Tax=Trichomalopsis sarcophagae TaxID=543379 RepID=A0A232EYW0_9HYME|nr:hypothetical protein TSAR_014989 [Trichomalopsis sarcophagae]